MRHRYSTAHPNAHRRRWRAPRRRRHRPPGWTHPRSPRPGPAPAPSGPRPPTLRTPAPPPRAPCRNRGPCQVKLFKETRQRLAPAPSGPLRPTRQPPQPRCREVHPVIKRPGGCRAHTCTGTPSFDQHLRWKGRHCAHSKAGVPQLEGVNHHSQVLHHHFQAQSCSHPCKSTCRQGCPSPAGHAMEYLMLSRCCTAMHI